MYPKESVSLEIKFDAQGHLITGPVLWTTDMAPGRIAANAIMECLKWDRWARKVNLLEVLIVLLLPNSTAISALMDFLFGPFKAGCHEMAQIVFAARVYAHAKEVERIKKVMADSSMPSKEEKKTLKSTVRLEPEDVGKIVFGELQDDTRLPHPNSSFSKHFTPEKIGHGAAEVSSFSLFALE